MKTFYGDDGNYADIPLKDILDRMTDDWIYDEFTSENISELRDACRKLLETAHNSDYAKCLDLARKLQSKLGITKNLNMIAEIIQNHFA
jgi:hypothetical protein